MSTPPPSHTGLFGLDLLKMPAKTIGFKHGLDLSNKLYRQVTILELKFVVAFTTTFLLIVWLTSGVVSLKWFIAKQEEMEMPYY